MHYIVLLIAKLVVIERVARKSKGGGDRCEERWWQAFLLENPFPD